ncbi:MAG TPA: DUF4430 domain-containing protein [Thermoleophilia bacterium]|nr:DUF4430 domain-containing protein [Thermoleophilia bacterium]
MLLLLMIAGLAGCAGVQGKATPAVNGQTPTSGEVRLIVTQHFGATVMLDEVVPWKKGLAGMSLLAEHARVDTEYGGGFVSGIDGVKSTFGGVSSAQAADWFYWVDGIMAGVGAADYRLHGGETVWWDFHQWAHAMSIPATLSAFPAPWKGHALEVATSRDWPGLQQWAQASGLTLSATKTLTAGAPSGGLVVATPQEVTATKWLGELLDGGDGVRLVRLGSEGISLLSPTGARGPSADAVALALPDENNGHRPSLVVLADSTSAAQRLFALLTPGALAARVGVALVDGRLVALPWHAQ